MKNYIDNSEENYKWNVAFCPSLNNNVNRLVRSMNKYGNLPWPLCEIGELKKEKLKRKLVKLKNAHFDFGFYCAFGNLIGESVWFTNTYILDYAPIYFGKNITIGPDVKLITSWHVLENVNIVKAKPIIIKDNVWITMNAIILPGVIIGENSVIGAGSVVTKSVPPNTLVAGNPAKVIREIDRKYPFWEDLEKDLKIIRETKKNGTWQILNKIVRLPFILIRKLLIKLI
jgi:acetyltransferase-like isoleucine patch superfamily enzyme